MLWLANNDLKVEMFKNKSTNHEALSTMGEFLVCYIYDLSVLELINYCQIFRSIYPLGTPISV